MGSNMKFTLVGLSLVGAVVAQVSVNGMSMVSAATTDGGYYGSSSPAQATGYASSTSDASYAQYTPPPSYSSSYDIYSEMPYDSMTAGGYSSLDCGYGHTKAYDGSCQAESWVGRCIRRSVDTKVADPVVLSIPSMVATKRSSSTSKISSSSILSASDDRRQLSKLLCRD